MKKLCSETDFFLSMTMILKIKKCLYPEL